MDVEPIEGEALGVEVVDMFLEFVYAAMCTADTAGCEVAGGVLVLSTAPVDDHGSCGNDDCRDSCTGAQDAEAE